MSDFSSLGAHSCTPYPVLTKWSPHLLTTSGGELDCGRTYTPYKVVNFFSLGPCFHQTDHDSVVVGQAWLNPWSSRFDEKFCEICKGREGE